MVLANFGLAVSINSSKSSVMSAIKTAGTGLIVTGFPVFPVKVFSTSASVISMRRNSSISERFGLPTGGVGGGSAATGLDRTTDSATGGFTTGGGKTTGLAFARVLATGLTAGLLFGDDFAVTTGLDFFGCAVGFAFA